MRLNPKFALRRTLLSYTNAFGYRSLILQPTVAVCEESPPTAGSALILQPNLGEADYHYACAIEYDTVMRYFEQARE